MTDDVIGPEHMGHCDGCPDLGYPRRTQLVRRVVGDWGVTYVCAHHMWHED